MAPLQVVIDGGKNRQVFVDDDIILDASQSRDVSLPPHVEQNLQFRWICESHVQNTYCLSIVKNSTKFSITKGNLPVGFYRFIATIRDPSTSDRNKSDAQTVELTKKKPILVKIICVKNCEYPVNPIFDVFLEVDCNIDDYQYDWKVNGTSVGNGKRLQIKSKQLQIDTKYEITLDVKQNENNGSTAIEIKTNSPPSGGNCDLEPKSGISLFTEFTITCYKYNTDHEPLEYRVYNAGQLIVSSFHSNLKFRLCCSGDVEIRIIDSYGVFISMRNQIEIESILITKPDEIISFLLGNTSYGFPGLKELLTAGDTPGAVVLLQFALTKLIEIDDEKYKIFKMMSTTILESSEIDPTPFDLESISTIFTNITINLKDVVNVDLAEDLIRFLDKLNINFQQLSKIVELSTADMKTIANNLLEC